MAADGYLEKQPVQLGPAGGLLQAWAGPHLTGISHSLVQVIFKAGSQPLIPLSSPHLTQCAESDLVKPFMLRALYFLTPVHAEPSRAEPLWLLAEEEEAARRDGDAPAWPEGAPEGVLRSRSL